MSDFLDLIEKKMIIVEPRHRKSRGPENREKPGRIRTESLKQELKSLLEKCGDESYALSPKPGKQKEVEL
jgi:hypothetical protein